MNREDRTARTTPWVALSCALAAGCRLWDIGPIVDDRRASDAAQDAAERDEGLPDAWVDASASDAATDAAAIDPCPSHRAQITSGVGAIDVRTYLFSPLVVHGARACPVMVTPRGRPFAAVAEEGDGRVAWLGHDALLSLVATQRDVAPLLRNTMAWAGRRALRELRIGVAPEAMTGTLPAFFAQEGVSPRMIAARDLRAGEVDVWVAFATTAPTASNEQQIVRDFVASGGGILLAGQAWNWARSRPSDPIEAYPGNALVPSAGITAMAEPLSTAETTAGASIAVTELSHATRAVEALGAHLSAQRTLSATQQQTLFAVLRDAAKVTPIGAQFWAQARRSIAGSALPATSATAPLSVAAQPIEASVHALVGRINAHGPSEWIEAVRGAEGFPGAVGMGARRESVTVAIDGDTAAGDARRLYAQSGARVWRSTGVYAPPGESLTIRVSSALASAGLGVRIGAHERDLTDEPTWSRAPRVSREQLVTSASTTAASVYGGLVYITVAPGSRLGAMDVTIDGGVRAASFVLSRDRGEDARWLAEARASAAPWLELVGERVVLTVATEAALAVSSPTELTEYWDRAQRELDDFAGIEGAFQRAERVVFDPQLAGGAAADSGYPAVRARSRTSAALDLAALRTNGDWGGYFVLARAAQSTDWLVAGSQDATVSVLSLYALERVTGVAHTAPPIVELAASARGARIDAYVAGGRDFSGDWSGFTALETYLQLVEGFGWTPLRQCVREIAALPVAERPTTADARLQQWAQRSARAAGRDLSPFYQRWGWPVSAATRATTAALPSWAEQPARP